MAVVTAIVGVGPGNGAHFARTFANGGNAAAKGGHAAEKGGSAAAKGGHALALMARSQDYVAELAEEIAAAGGKALAVPVDITDERAVSDAFAKVRADLGEVDNLIQNAAMGQRGPFMDIPPDGFNQSFQVSVMGMVHCCREVLPGMERKGAGSIILIGATAAFRGGAGFSAFAVAKFGQRALAQSIAREYMPKGIHVAHVNIDGVIDSERSRQRMPDKPDEFFLHPADIAAAVWYLVHQPRSTWTHELDLRPYVEKW